jgi:hypothetical protein
MAVTTISSGQVWISWTTSGSSSTTTSDWAWDSWSTADSGTSWYSSPCDGMWTSWVIASTPDNECGFLDRKMIGEEARLIYTDFHEKKTTEQKRAELAQSKLEREWHRYLAKELERERREAEQTAQELLAVLIGQDQLKVYQETGHLFVKGLKYDYIINKGGFVTKIEKDKIVDLCVHLENQYSFPETDNVIALKLMIDDNEDEILKIANHHYHHDRPAILPLAACG